MIAKNVSDWSEPRAHYRLADDAALIEIGGELGLFSKKGETLYTLNGAAAVAASQLATGTSFAALVEALADDDTDRASIGPLAQTLLRQWSACKVVQADRLPFPKGWRKRQTIRIAKLVAELNYSSEALRQRVSPVFAHLAVSEGEPTVRLELSETDGLVLVSRHDEGGAIVAALEAAPIVKGLLTEEVLATAPPDIALHAACLLTKGQALLLTGAPGAGKTTLTLALPAAGFSFAADDITLLAPDGRVRGIPFAPAVKGGAWPLLRNVVADLDAYPTHRRLDGVEVRYLAPKNPPVTDWLNVGWAVHLCRAADVAPRLIPLTPAQALTRLMAEAHSAAGPADLDTLRAIVSVAERARAFDLVYSDLGDAVRILVHACAHA